MKDQKTHWFTAIMTLGLVIVATGLAVPSKPCLQDDEGKSAVVHLSHFTDDLHRAFMALKVANMMQAGGVDTTMFLDIEGARVGDSRQSLKVRWGSSELTLSELYEKFVAAGGKVVVCPHCAKAAGLTPEHVRDGATIATEEELAEMFVAADKIMDY